MGPKYRERKRLKNILYAFSKGQEEYSKALYGIKKSMEMLMFSVDRLLEIKTS